MQGEPEVFETTREKTNLMLKAIQERFGWADRQKAYLALRVVLQTLRDRLPVEQAVALAAQLPMLVRGFYYEGWKPLHAPKKMNRAEFIGEIERQFLTAPEENTEEMIRGVVAVVQSYTDPSELRKIKSLLPEDLAKIMS